jgi:hypothetical protein
MLIFLKQVFKMTTKNKNYNDVIQKLQDYMLTEDNMKTRITILTSGTTTSIGQMTKSSTPSTSLKNMNNKSKENIFLPKEKDTLFWCFYVIKYGFSSYEYPGNTSFSNEKNEKFKFIELLRINKNDLKNHKIKNIKEDIEDELANKEIIGIKTFMALCISEKINIFFVHKRKYYELLVVDGNPFHIIHFNDKNYYYEMNDLNETTPKILYYKENYFKLENFDKPLKSITYYKVNELTEIYNKLNNECQNNDDSLKKKTKKEIYDLILLIL